MYATRVTLVNSANRQQSKVVRGNSRLDDWWTLGRCLEQPLVLRLEPCALHLAPGSSWWWWSSSPFLYLDHQIYHKVCESSSLPVPSSTYLFSLHLKFLLLNILYSTYDNDSHLDIEESTFKQIKFFFSFPLQIWYQPRWGRDTIKNNFLKRETIV